jgi:predicted protein tyrosine phosphatase
MIYEISYEKQILEVKNKDLMTIVAVGNMIGEKTVHEIVDFSQEYPNGVTNIVKAYDDKGRIILSLYDIPIVIVYK